MTPTTVLQRVAADIDAYMRRNGGGYGAWYCGIAADPRQRLFTDHNVAENGGLWIFRDCQTDTGARAVEDHFHGLGGQGGPSGGDHTTKYVYAYKVTATTRE